jgi:polysaccharide biosynthesis protein VpsJ
MLSISDQKVLQVHKNVLSTLQLDHYAGYDPFDLLNSKVFKSTKLLNSPIIRLISLQLGKRSPINLRQLLLVPKERNPKGIGLMVSSLLMDYTRSKNSEYLNEAEKLGTWLIDNRSSNYSYSCWGYHFDWQARAFYVPKGTPNIITTYYVARALFELGKITNNESYLNVAIDAAHFMSQHLFNKSSKGSYFRYIPNENTFVHNASLWGASLCVQIGNYISDSSLIDKGMDAVQTSRNAQKTDGSWYYGSRNHHKFIDGFHSGYNLEALQAINDIIKCSEIDACIQLGYNYYLRTFITDDADVKYYSNSIFPLDVHSYAQAIITISKIGSGEQDFILCQAVLARMIEKFYLENKASFIYQKKRFYKNRINYMRWTQAWAYFSMSTYLSIENGGRDVAYKIS